MKKTPQKPSSNTEKKGLESNRATVIKKAIENIPQELRTGFEKQINDLFTGITHSLNNMSILQDGKESTEIKAKFIKEVTSRKTLEEMSTGMLEELIKVAKQMNNPKSRPDFYSSLSKETKDAYKTILKKGKEGDEAREKTLDFYKYIIGEQFKKMKVILAENTKNKKK